MIKNYLKTAFRSFGRNKLYTTLNVAGLTFGIAWFLLIGLYLFDELTFDKQHSKAERIYRVVEHKSVNGESTVIAAAGLKLATESRGKIAEVENTTHIQRAGRANIINLDDPTIFFQETVTVADENLLTIFDFPLLEGDRATALKEPNTVIINEDLALRLFGTKQVVGKNLQFSHMDAPLRVTGLLKNHPRNSSFDFSSVISHASFNNSNSSNETGPRDWFSNDYSVYALLRKDADPQSVAARITKLVHDNFTAPAGTSFSYALQSLPDMHLHSQSIVDGGRNTNVDSMAKGSPFYIKLFAFVALFVLIIAGINYMNLTTARASGRLKEIGVRKTIGAFRVDLIRQFLVESMLVTFISFLFAVGLVNIVLPAFNEFTGKELSLGINTDYRIWLCSILFVVMTGLLAGSYPALMLSRFRPVLLLKGLKLANRTDLSLRKSLVVFQFAISVVMIIGTIVLYLQVRFMNNTDLGFNQDLLVVIDVNVAKARSNFEAVKAEMAKIPSVKSVSVTSRVPGEWKTYRTLKLKNKGSGDDPRTSYMFGADKDFLRTFEVKLLKGRNFGTINDSSSILVNETAAKMLGIIEPSGQQVDITAIADDGSFRQLDNPVAPRIVGIVKDFHFQSLRDKIEPLVLAYNYNPIQPIDYYSARISSSNVAATLDQLKKVMVNNDKNDPFEYHFLDEQLARFYLEDARRQTLLIWVALATIFIACLGLFGLATYAAEQRVKEIGVRKVLGAGVFNLATLLSRDFLKLVLVANGIAFPVAWWAVNKWLQEYAYHIDVQWWVFAGAGATALLIALATVSFQAIKAALANPVKSLRTE